MVREAVPDAIILDWMIEQVSGIEVCRQLRKDRDLARVPIVMLTARGEEEDRIRGLKTGADDYVTKPFSTRELMARVEALLRRSAARARGRHAERRRHRARRRLAPRAPRGRGAASRAHRVPAAALFHGAHQPRASRASRSSTACGASTATSTSAPSTSTSAACARRSSEMARKTRSAPSARRGTRWMRDAKPQDEQKKRLYLLQTPSSLRGGEADEAIQSGTRNRSGLPRACGPRNDEGEIDA